MHEAPVLKLKTANANGALNNITDKLLKICARDFFKPSKDARVLTILHSLSENPNLNQNELGQRTSLSGAMVNTYLKDLADQGFIQYIPTNGKCFRYALTPKGEETRSILFSRYCTEIIQSYSAIKLSIRAKLLALHEQGITQLAFFGASETCEVALAASKESPLKIVAVVDNEPSKHGQFFHGYIISSPDILNNLHIQAVVITTFGHRQEIHDQIKPLADRKQWEIVSL